MKLCPIRQEKRYDIYYKIDFFLNWANNVMIAKNERTYISVELSDKAREIVVFEVSRKKISGERVWIPNNKASASSVPRNYVTS